MKKTTLVLVSSLFLFALSAKAADKPGGSPNPTTQTAGAYQEITKKGITFKWAVDGQNLKVILKSPEKGWVACGFNPSFMMFGANIIIAYVKDGKLVIRHDTGTEETSHGPFDDGKNKYFIKASGKVDNTGTQISFTIPLDPKNPKIKPMKKWDKITVLLAYSDKDDFTVEHKERTSVDIQL